ncbi:MAG: autotransporter assembly complex family protein [Geminicoccaceae bacterium]
MPPRRWASYSVLGLALLATGCSKDQGGLDRPAAEGPRIPYTVAIEGEMPGRLKTLLENASAAKRLEHRPPSSEFALVQRARTDVPQLVAALHSEGYYAGKVEYRIGPAPAGGVKSVLSGDAAGKEQITFTVEPGPQFVFGQAAIDVTPGSAFKSPTPAKLGLVPGSPARSQTVLTAEQRLLRAAQEQSFALAKAGERDVIVDYDTRLMDVTLHLIPGPPAKFGPIEFQGSEGIRTRFLRTRLPFAEGEPYKASLVDEGRGDLVDTNLFSTVVIHQANELNADGELPVDIELRQRAPRSIGAGLNYETNVGPGAVVFWEHRNLFGNGERLRLDASANPQEQQFTFAFRRPDVLTRRQDLLIDGNLGNANTNAYSSLSAGIGVALERQITDKLTVSAGPRFRFADIDDNDRRQTFSLLSFPMRLSYDFSNSALDPTKGGRTILSAQPTVDVRDPGIHFLKSTARQTFYVPISHTPDLVLALRGALGSIVGTDRENVPADERYYAGGGGSVRGVTFQKAGPLDSDNNPIGGRSLLELSTELRWRITETMGVVAFVDAGSSFDQTFPDLAAEPLRWGAGPGFRYFTPIGPVRLDVGFPLNPRDGVDDPFQVYISLGQAF